MKINVIFSTDPQGVIGNYDGNYTQPFHSKKDFDWFKKITQNKCICMGYNTYKAIGKALPNRKNIVLTTLNISLEDARVVNTIKEAIAIAHINKFKEIYFIGGAKVLEQVYALADEVFVTKFNNYVDASESSIIFNPLVRNDLQPVLTQYFSDVDTKTGLELTGEFIHLKSVFGGL